MDIKVPKIYRLDGNGMTKAFCDVTVDGKLVLRGFRVVEGKNGFFVGYPQELNDGKWYLRVYTKDEDVKAAIEREVLKAYAGDNSEVSVTV